MRRSFKLLGFTACGLGVLLAIAVLVLPMVLNSTFVQQRLQAAAAASVALELGIDGRVEADFFPGLQFTVNDLHFSRQGSVVATVRQVRIGLDLIPLLHGALRVNGIALEEPVILLERYADGTYNVTKPEPHVTLNLARIEVTNATFHYNDAVLGTRYEANTCHLDLHGARPLTRDSIHHLADVDLTSELGCAELRKDALTLTDLALTVRGQDGTIRLEPVSVRMFGAEGTGLVHADFTGVVPVYRVQYSLAQFRIDDLFRMLVPQTTSEGLPVEGTLAEGLMDFSTEVSMQGSTLLDMQRALAGHITLSGENLAINGTDLDETIARFESSQNFNLVDAGALLLAGPLGLALTKGYNFANIFTGSGTRSEIRSLVSDWDVADGVAEAQYVMMATPANRIALKGGLDLANREYRNVTMALLDDAGCARIEQTLQGPFRNPVIEKPTVLRSLAGPVRALLQKLAPPEACEPFYLEAP